jgi:uncharacterized protein (TIGR02246 family)
MTDEDQIREMQALWAQRHADKDAGRWADLFAEDGKYMNPRGGVYVGRQAIREYFVDRFLPGGVSDRRSTHTFGPPVIRVTGDTAVSATDYTSCSLDPEKGLVVGAIGRMFCHLKKQNGRWYFSEYRIVNHPDPLPSADHD